MSADGSVLPGGAEDPGQLFLDMLAAERGAAANTLAAYRRDLDDYLGYLAQQGIDPEEAQADQVRHAELIDQSIAGREFNPCGPFFRADIVANTLEIGGVIGHEKSLVIWAVVTADGD